MKGRWTNARQCGKCGIVDPMPPSTKTAATPVQALLLVWLYPPECRCGGAYTTTTRVGRRIYAWWAPWTWFRTRWEWRDDDAVDLDAEVANDR